MDTPDDKKVPAKKSGLSQASIVRDQTYTELHNASDRVCAVVWGASIHDLIKQLVQVKLIKHDDHAHRLFGADGPLANFSVLHNLAHAMGLIGDDVRNDIYCVREIRNTFAHNVSVINSLGNRQIATFKTDSVASHCNNLKCPEIVPATLSPAHLTAKRLGRGEQFHRTKDNRLKSARWRFEWTCQCLSFMLWAAAHNPKQRQRCRLAPTARFVEIGTDWQATGSPLDYPRA
jgi:hypothetical protein